MSNPFSAWTPHPITSHNTTSTCPTDDDEDAALKLGLFLKIIKSKTSLGLSVWFLFLGSFGNVDYSDNCVAAGWECECPRFMIYWGVAVALLVVACLVMQWETMTVGTMVGLGMVSLGMTLVQYLPQIWRTVKDRAPGALSETLFFVYSISLQPGTDWTSWIAFLASGSFQFLLLLLCLFYSVTEREGYVRIPDAGAPPIVPEEGERRPLLGQGIEIEDDVERRG
ncbi:hypothetical protein BC829DRAFT_397543 [Chytridium lagenaria]|nr:hypothetical protein BC829DRAFT_397543 [Chytridium lagenaria]